MVSIMPGMDMAEPERTEISRGFSPVPKVLPVFSSSACICVRTSSMTPAGSSFSA